MAEQQNSTINATVPEPGIFSAIEASDPLVWVGFGCGLLSAFGSCAALMVIRLSTEKEAHLPLCQRKLFFIGAWSNLACEIGLTSAALALCPLSLLSPISGLTICFGAIFAWVGLFGTKRERAVPLELGALFITVAGVGISALFGPSGEGIPDLYDTSWRMVGWPHLVYAFTGWSIAISWLAINTFDRRLGRFRPPPGHPINAPLSGTTSGWLASYSLSMFKFVMTALRRAFGGDWAGAKYTLVWVCAALLFPVASTQVYSLNLTMGSGGTNYVLPWYTVMTIVLSSTAGGMIFDEFSRLPPQSILIFWIGVVITMGGLFILAVFQAKRARLAADEKASPTRAAKDGSSPHYPSSDGDIELHTAGAPASLPSTAPEGYVPDERCYFCGAGPLCGKAWW